MKLSDYVVGFVEGIADSIFLLSGGGIMHLVDSVRKSNLRAFCCHHEQAAAIAAEGYARIKNDLGVILVTTGPGGTNAITGVAGAWLDSIPVLVISGQVKTDNIMPRKQGVPTIRALGFQELNITDIVAPITKYAVVVEEADLIRYHLEKAVHMAKTGRPGPVWVDIPLDIQAEDITASRLKRFTPPPSSMFKKSNIPMDIIVAELKKAKRPLLLVGNGVRLAGAVDILWKVLKKFNINAATVLFTADDIVTYEYPHYLGRQGMWGNKTANWAIDNCDLLLVVGDRLQLTQTSYDYARFATQATKIMVDIDKNELHKKTLQIDIPVHCDARYFLEELYKQNLTLARWDITADPFNPTSIAGKKTYTNVYGFMQQLGDYASDHNIATSDAMAAIVTHQALKIKKGQRLITNAGLGQMGSGLPLSIGACIARGKKPVICIEGDGSLMLNIQELQTIAYHKLPIKLFILNNGGYYSIRNTHRNYFNKVFAADSKTGVGLPNYEKLMKAWGFKYVCISNNRQLHKIKQVMKEGGPVVCEIMIDPDQPILPKWTAGQFRNKKIN